MVTIPAIETPPCGCMVMAVPTLIPPFAVTTPANAALPLAEIVAALPTFIFPLPPVLSTFISPTTSSMFVLVLKSRLPSVVSSPAAPTITMPCCVRSLTFAVSATKASMFAVPSMNKSCHSLPAAPIFLLPSVSGIKLLPIDVKVDTPDMFNLLLVVTPLTLIPCGVV
jgi:hypothetical protein